MTTQKTRGESTINGHLLCKTEPAPPEAGEHPFEIGWLRLRAAQIKPVCGLSDLQHQRMKGFPKFAPVNKQCGRLPSTAFADDAKVADTETDALWGSMRSLVPFLAPRYPTKGNIF